jgi:hypothetical protein
MLSIKKEPKSIEPNCIVIRTSLITSDTAMHSAYNNTFCLTVLCRDMHKKLALNQTTCCGRHKNFISAITR